MKLEIIFSFFSIISFFLSGFIKKDDKKSLFSFFINLFLLIFAFIFSFALSKNFILFENFLYKNENLSFSLLIYFTSIISLTWIMISGRKFSINRYEIFTVATIFSFISSSIVNSKLNLISIYVLIEAMSICQIFLILLSKEGKFRSEIALKYLFTNSIGSIFYLCSSAILLFLNGSFDLNQVLNLNSSLSIAYIFILVSIFIKIGIAPVHFLIPDLYSDLEFCIINFINIIPKISMVWFFYKITNIFILSVYQKNVLICIFIFSITFSTIRCLMNKNIKRIISYSGITNMSILLMFIMSFNGIKFKNIENIIFLYLLIYSLSSFLSMLSSAFIFKKNSSDEIEMEDGIFVLDKIFLVIGILSLAGSPPFYGFFVKFLILKEIISLSSNGYIYNFAVISILLSTVISSFYYIYFFKLSFAEQKNQTSINRNFFSFRFNTQRIISIFISLYLIFGFFVKF